ncbi:AMP-binding protein [Roseiterribacter gracilis]|uniref:3-methylmercaptopropionyl-CoA ligase n=1 Tax=Roseiterribacter gracilis TaxID=2812848 RepID=A0A8S8XG95_9PROT|nr:4-coumarate--CoA ligase [Rhodospirillales bacterium TMPK1]
MTAARDSIALYGLQQPDRLAAVDLATGRRWSYGALDQAVARCSGWLVAQGVGAGDRVAVLARNSVELLILQFACMRRGAIFVPLNWRLAAAELGVLLEDCTPSLFVADVTCTALAAQAGWRALQLAEMIAAIERAAPAPPVAFDENAPSILLYTSGTSGRPKGVIVTERNAHFTARNFGAFSATTSDSIYLCESPMFHVIGLVTSFRAPLLQGGVVLVSDGFDAARTNRRLADPSLGVTHYFCVPQMAAMLRADPDFAPERLVGRVTMFTGGAPLDATDLAPWLADRIVLANGFGMTEVGTVTCMPLDLAAIAARPRSVGPVAPLQEMRLVDSAGADVEPGAVGEIWLRGPNVSPGYWQREDATRAAFTDDGWFRTGDAATRDEDGFVTLVDRLKDMFISGGENIYPAEVEAALLAHPDIVEAAVVGIEDARWGEVGHAALVLRAGAAFDEQAVIAHCNARIARYKIPRSFAVLDALPRTGSGKVLKHVLKSMHAAKES